jgi:hypothetical protein
MAKSILYKIPRSQQISLLIYLFNAAFVLGGISLILTTTFQKLVLVSLTYILRACGSESHIGLALNI